jgi:hypothetical protein
MSIRFWLSIFLVSLFSNSLFAEEDVLIGEESAVYAPAPVMSSIEVEPYGPILDRHASPYVGANLIITGLRGYQWLDDKFFPSTAGDTSGPMILARFGRLAVIDVGLVLATGMIIQHEVFGHGFRLREFGVKQIGYRIKPWEGLTTYSSSQYNQLSFSEKAAVSTGGMEANTILANQLRTRWVDSEVIDSREATLYLLSSLDQTAYVLEMSKRDDTFANGHDVAEYVRDVNSWYQRPVVSMQKLKKRAWLDFFDPYLFYSAYSMGDYVLNGTQQWEYPMLSIGEYRYLPAARMVLAPYGAEYQLNNFIKGPYTIFANVRYGNTGGRQSSAIGVEVVNFFKSDLLKIGAKVDLWNQPKLFTTNASFSSTKFGGAASLIARYRVLEKLDVVGQAGYKTSGYIPGEILKHSPILRVGLSAYL